jgi:hypothetical protein
MPKPKIDKLHDMISSHSSTIDLFHVSSLSITNYHLK